MMGFGYDGMMNWRNGGMAWFGALGIIFWLVILIDLMLLGFWLWKQLNKK